MRIYLISEDGAAWAGSIAAAHILTLGGYKECTKEEYQAQLRRIRRNDIKDAKLGLGDPRGEEPAGGTNKPPGGRAGSGAIGVPSWGSAVPGGYDE